MPKYFIKHITRYSYPNQVTDSANQVMLFPTDDEHQDIKKHELVITQQPLVKVFSDYFGNKVGVFSVIQPHNELTITSLIEVITREVTIHESNESASSQWENLESTREQLPYLDFMLAEHCDSYEEIFSVVQSMKNGSVTPLALAQQMSAFVYKNFQYKKGITNIETKVDEIWKIKAGVCQDFAHVLLVMLRIAGIPARYVSGYICPKGHELRGEGATHAWVETYIPTQGWIGLDPTNDCIASDRHVRLAIGRSFTDCTPVKGTYKGSSEHLLEVSVIIESDASPNKIDAPFPVFSYQAHNPGAGDNSYRRFVETQQQQ